MRSNDAFLLRLGVDLMMPPAEVQTVDQYRQYIHKVITQFSGQGGVSTVPGRPRDVISTFLREKVAKNPEKYIHYDGDMKELGAFHRNKDQSGLDEDELRLSNGTVLVFPGPVCAEPDGMICVKVSD